MAAKAHIRATVGARLAAEEDVDAGSCGKERGAGAEARCPVAALPALPLVCEAACGASVTMAVATASIQMATRLKAIGGLAMSSTISIASVKRLPLV